MHDYIFSIDNKQSVATEPTYEGETKAQHNEERIENPIYSSTTKKHSPAQENTMNPTYMSLINARDQCRPEEHHYEVISHQTNEN